MPMLRPEKNCITYAKLEYSHPSNSQVHVLQTPNEGINQRNLKSWADMADKMCFSNWADDKQSKAQNSDSKYRQMALVGFDT